MFINYLKNNFFKLIYFASMNNGYKISASLFVIFFKYVDALVDPERVDNELRSELSNDALLNLK